ncbi:hypothetical protein DPEC_G00061090 [Dallia pectoralis]|uniref:Uncharacterized protein n=1 Tax=Dallia pectoralis TaxID=75939 RepID=A0ACC2H7I7_DALPE|nr:hypothetical protein DPEC_G00061090 [Dallia pectoralis]
MQMLLLKLCAHAMPTLHPNAVAHFIRHTLGTGEKRALPEETSLNQPYFQVKKIRVTKALAQKKGQGAWSVLSSAQASDTQRWVKLEEEEHLCFRLDSQRGSNYRKMSADANLRLPVESSNDKDCCAPRHIQ